MSLLFASEADSEEMFGRKVMTTLIEALSTLKAMAEEIDPGKAGEKRN